MNLSNQPPAPHRPTDEQLEERIVAWVLGEASEFEIAALQSAVAARPELAVFKRRIEAVHGLVAAAERPDAEPLRLSPARRAELLLSLGVTEPATTPASTAPAAKKPAVRAKSSVLTMPLTKKPPFWQQPWFYSAAACVGISIVGFWMLSTVSTKESDLRMAEVATKAAVFDLAVPDMSTEREEDAEPMNMVGSSDIITVIKPSPPVTPRSASVAWSVPSKQTRALATAPSLPKPQLAMREVEVASARGYTGTADDGSTGVMEPFEVKEESDVGYCAASATLAGSRLNTNLNLPGMMIRTELKDVASSVSTNAEEKASLRDRFLTTRKATYGVKGGRAASPAPSAPVALGGEKATDKEEEVIVLSPFEVAKSPDFLKKTSRSSSEKRPKRPNPMATVGMGPDALNADQVLQPAQPTTSSPSTPSTPSSATDADKPLPRPAQKPLPPASIEEVSAAQEAVSTFSLHVSDVSFKLALAALAAGTWPDRATIRPEEFYNAFDYGDPATAASEKISCRIEQAAHPFAQQRNLVRIALRVPATGRGAGQPLHLTVLLDTSGSMERPDRRATVRAALATLVGLLGPADRLTLIGFARQPRLLAEALDGNHANQALDLLDRTPAEGGTNLEEALNLGGQLARRQFSTTAQNRLVLLTDGAANLGNADPDHLTTAVEALRAQRIAFDACGVGLDGLDDTILEALTRKGDGRYYVLNAPASADAGFARQLAGALRPAAENVKVQVRFNPARVGRYRLVGFEKHRLREEDFRNDAVDAAELAAEEAAVAVYEIEAKPQGEGEVGEVFVRFRDAATKEMVERSWTLPYEARAAVFDRASPSIQLAGTAAMLAEKIRGGPAGDRVELDTLAPIVNALRSRRPDDQRIQELATMFAQLRRLEGK